MRTLVTAGIHTGVALLLAAAATLPLVLLGLVSIGDDAPLFGRVVHWQLEVETIEAPPAVALMERARADTRMLELAPHLRLEARDGRAWLVGVFGDAGRDRVAAAVDDSGLWTGRVELSSAWAQTLSELIRRPGDIPRSFASLVPWFVAGTGLSFLICALFFRHRYPPAPESEVPGVPPAAVVAGIGVGAVAFVIAHVLAIGLKAVGLEQTEQPWVLELARGPWAGQMALAAVAVIVAPFAEELFFRGHIFRLVRERVGPWLAYGASMALFAGVHFNPPALPSYLFLGAMFCWGYERWRSLAVPVTAHATVNALSLAQLVLV